MPLLSEVTKHSCQTKGSSKTGKDRTNGQRAKCQSRVTIIPHIHQKVGDITSCRDDRFTSDVNYVFLGIIFIRVLQDSCAALRRPRSRIAKSIPLPRVSAWVLLFIDGRDTLHNDGRWQGLEKWVVKQAATSVDSDAPLSGKYV